MLRLFSTLIFLVMALVCIWLAVANRNMVTLSLSPVDIAIEMPLFFVGLLGVLIGIVAVLPTASLKAFMLRRRLAQTQKKLAALEDKHADLTVERDGLAAQVRPEDERFAKAQMVEAGPQGSLTGPSSQTVLPG